MQSWSWRFPETARHDCMGFGNNEWLTESFNRLYSIQLELGTVDG